jgi:NAD(P)-dependent dehydrogenase (short-subunit alcohol dehydrogenase family)
VCADCGAAQYPPRESCRRCLSDRLPWADQSGTGELIAETTVHVSQNDYFRERVPWRVGMVRLDVGVTVIAHLPAVGGAAPARVRVAAKLDKSGQGVLVAFPLDEVMTMAEDRQLREMTCDPKGRTVLVTDGETAVGQALVRHLLAAGAEQIWVGHGRSWSQLGGGAGIAALPRVVMKPLDVTDSKSVRRLARDVAGQLDILINSAEVHRPYGIESSTGIDVAQAEMDVNYLGLLRLAQEMGPAMKSRQSELPAGPLAWVNLLSIYALSNFPPHGTFSASKAAALSLSQCLRAEMRPAGIRVINVFPGPIDDEWSGALPAPKLTPDALAKAVIEALQEGVEDVYPGDVARDWLLRWRENPKLLEYP